MSSCPSDCFDNKINVSRNELYLPLDPPLKKSGKSGLSQDQCVVNKNILDIGCGEGFLSQKCIEEGASNVYGIDISDEAIRKARERFGITCMQMDVKEHCKLISFAPSIDIIVCNPAQIPLPSPLLNGYFVGTDGRNMIDEVLIFTSEYIKKYPNTELIMTHTNLSNPDYTIQKCYDMGLIVETIPDTEHYFPIYEEFMHNEKIISYFGKITNNTFNKNRIMGCLLRIYKGDNKEAKA
eukprot:g10863.t1